MAATQPPPRENLPVIMSIRKAFLLDKNHMIQPMTPHFFQSSLTDLEAERFDLAALRFPGDFDMLDA
ncbi:hypothetical protein CLIM01_08581 [Colletotrichum limetticola]|uniref:Uncharacterized protein n=1 Tax=Colletotrichum limetticola TaxID=1209924 RepID=A0ABQ9PRA4_9PEZI|nr:hypothetical protein CLIM01_08581 [Colletotrichum limetticola]